ncbi:MAG: TetR family transcriptional regulator [Alphaproteobacteria bacterium]|nr:TetR family transcriptional regulator [Alphaproteobacteria bacterium]
MLDRRAAARRAGMPEDLGKAEATRQSILAAAARIFRADGYAGARLSDIAAAVGMKAGSLYYHFESREALVAAVMAQGLHQTHEMVARRLKALPKKADHLSRLEVAIAAHLELVLANEDITSATIKLIWQVPPPIRDRQIADQRAYGALWRELLLAARKAGAIREDVDLSVVRMAIMGALNWAADWYKPGRMTPDEIARDIAAVVLGGLAAPRPTKRKRG